MKENKQMVKSQKITWLLYHQPVELFLRTANSFAKEITRLTQGRIEVDIQTLEDYCNEHHGGKLVDPISLMDSGAVHMSQTQVGYIGHWGAEDFYALEMPFLFDSHAHATRVLEGEIGENMLNSLADNSPVRGLAFTYSGGFRCIASNKPITKATDLEGLHMTVKTNPVFTDTANALGCRTTALTEFSYRDYLDQVRDPNSETKASSDLFQTTAIRFNTDVDHNHMPYLFNSKHSMYLTSILVSESFWQILTPEEQVQFKKAAFEAARLEREWSVRDGDEILKTVKIQSKMGIKAITEFDADQIDILKEKTQSVYKKYENIFTPGLLNDIRAA
jgi:TRAP-type C4-dicarboxylate transport system substrate-binding protein